MTGLTNDDLLVLQVHFVWGHLEVEWCRLQVKELPLATFSF